jgi:hypothetical protein
MDNPQEHTNFLLETLWVMFAYGPWHLAAGMAVSSVAVIWASRCIRRRFRLPILATAVLVLWIAMFIAADSGYQAWQGSPNAPDDAYSDTGPIFFLLAGWLPSWGVTYLLLLLFQLIFQRPRVSPPPLPSKSR